MSTLISAVSPRRGLQSIYPLGAPVPRLKTLSLCLGVGIVVIPNYSFEIELGVMLAFVAIGCVECPKPNPILQIAFVGTCDNRHVSSQPLSSNTFNCNKMNCKRLEIKTTTLNQKTGVRILQLKQISATTKTTRPKSPLRHGTGSLLGKRQLRLQFLQRRCCCMIM